MKTTLDLPEHLLQEAMQATHTTTKKAVIIKALKALLKTSDISQLKNYRGNIQLDINLNELRDRH